MMGNRRDRELPLEFKLLLVLREAITTVVPFRASPPRVICYYFKRADPGQITGQYHPQHRIELCSITRENDANGKEVSRETNIFHLEDTLAAHIKLNGHISPDDIVVNNTRDYPYFQALNFFNNVVPRPSWLDEQIQQEGV